MNVTQAEFAELISIDRTYYSLIELGRKNVRLDTLEKVAEGLKVLPYVLLKEAEKDVPGGALETRRGPRRKTEKAE